MPDSVVGVFRNGDDDGAHEPVATLVEAAKG